jgi:hypothetical protein
VFRTPWGKDEPSPSQGRSKACDLRVNGGALNVGFHRSFNISQGLVLKKLAEGVLVADCRFGACACASQLVICASVIDNRWLRVGRATRRKRRKRH